MVIVGVGVLCVFKKRDCSRKGRKRRGEKRGCRSKGGFLLF